MLPAPRPHLLPEGLLLQLHQHVQDVGHVGGAAELQRLVAERLAGGPLGQQRGQHVAGVQRGDGLVHLFQRSRWFIGLYSNAHTITAAVANDEMHAVSGSFNNQSINSLAIEMVSEHFWIMTSIH